MLSTRMLNRSPFFRQNSFLGKTKLSSKFSGNHGMMREMYLRQKEYLNASRKFLPSIQNIHQKRSELSPGIAKIFFSTSILKKSLMNNASNINKIMQSMSYNAPRGFMSSAYKGSLINMLH